MKVQLPICVDVDDLIYALGIARSLEFDLNVSVEDAERACDILGSIIDDLERVYKSNF